MTGPSVFTQLHKFQYVDKHFKSVNKFGHNWSQQDFSFKSYLPDDRRVHVMNVYACACTDMCVNLSVSVFVCVLKFLCVSTWEVCWPTEMSIFRL